MVGISDRTFLSPLHVIDLLQTNQAINFSRLVKASPLGTSLISKPNGSGGETKFPNPGRSLSHCGDTAIFVRRRERYRWQAPDALL